MQEFLLNLVKNAKNIFDQKHELIKHKSPNDLLSEADVKLNDYFVDAIKKEYPNARIIAEESENEPLTDDLTFVIDPLDGTCNYSMGILLCGIQLAVLEKKDPVFSIIYLPNADELYVAQKGQGAFLNGKRIVADPNIKHNDGILLLSDFYKEEKDIELDNQYVFVEDLRLSFVKTRLFGAACVDFAFLASSKAQAYVCYYRNIWDILPGLLLVKEAGMVYKRINGKEYKIDDQSLIVANNKETLDLILEKADRFIN